jgi:hypothetical protein
MNSLIKDDLEFILSIFLIPAHTHTKPNKELSQVAKPLGRLEENWNREDMIKLPS